MFGFIKKYFFTAITFIGFKLSGINSLECVSMNNQECKIRTEIIYLNTNEPMFYPYSIKINRCKSSLTQSMTYMLKYVFLTKLKTQM